MGGGAEESRMASSDRDYHIGPPRRLDAGAVEQAAVLSEASTRSLMTSSG